MRYDPWQEEIDKHIFLYNSAVEYVKLHWPDGSPPRQLAAAEKLIADYSANVLERIDKRKTGKSDFAS